MRRAKGPSFEPSTPWHDCFGYSSASYAAIVRFGFWTVDCASCGVALVFSPRIVATAFLTETTLGFSYFILFTSFLMGVSQLRSIARNENAAFRREVPYDLRHSQISKPRLDTEGPNEGRHLYLFATAGLLNGLGKELFIEDRQRVSDHVSAQRGN